MAKQPAQQKAQQQQGQYKAKLTAAGCPEPTADQVAQHLAGQGAANGITDDHVERLAAAAASRGVAMNWGALPTLLRLLNTNGPAVIEAVIALFGGGDSAGAAARP